MCDTRGKSVAKLVRDAAYGHHICCMSILYVMLRERVRIPHIPEIPWNIQGKLQPFKEEIIKVKFVRFELWFYSRVLKSTVTKKYFKYKILEQILIIRN